MTTTTITTAIASQINDEFSEFDSAEYTQEAAEQSPFAQIINPVFAKGQAKPFGLAILEENAQAINFNPTAEWELLEYEFKTKKKAKLWFSQTPRLLFVHQTGLYLKDKETNKIIGTGGKNYDKDKSQNFTIGFLLILRDDNSVAHDVFVDENGNKTALPLKISLTGIAGIRFGQKFISNRYEKRPKDTTGFVVDVESAYAMRRYNKPVALLNKEGIATIKKPDFWAHCVYCPTFEVDEVGKGENTSDIASVNNYELPTAKTIEKYLISPKSETGEIVRSVFDKYKNYQPAIASIEEAYGKPSDKEDDGFSPRKAVPNAVDELGGFDDDGKPPF
ncbi:MAG: DUF5895 domain-containing protein [Rhizonema sp. NSF051]|nr:DUF5895 domain-containing protein [Rhizonema sp. NSF051]